MPDDETVEQRVAALAARYRHALDEVRRLSVPDDRGIGERTARLSGLGAWEIEAERVRAELERLTGGPWPPPESPPEDGATSG